MGGTAKYKYRESSLSYGSRRRLLEVLMEMSERRSEVNNPKREQYHDSLGQLHFHIQWNTKGSIDWECFRSRDEAMSRAAELARPGEQFTIEEVSGNCPMRRAAAIANGG